MSVPRFMRSRTGAVGTFLLLFVVGFALLGPLLAPHAPDDPIGPPGETPSGAAPLGTDFLGRDVLSRVMHGGLSVLGLGVAATALSYALGLSVGLVAGYRAGVVDALLMRGVDVLLGLPGILLLLLLVSGLGTSVWVLLLGVALVQLPIIARLIRSSTLEVATTAYVEAAVARGVPARSIILRDITPNIGPVLLADFGVRFGYSLILIASMNYLNLGLQPPAADWGLMIAENRSMIDLNLWSVLAPAVLLALLTVAVNLIADAYTRTLGRSHPARRLRRAAAVPTQAAHEL